MAQNSEPFPISHTRCVILTLWNYPVYDMSMLTLKDQQALRRIFRHGFKPLNEKLKVLELKLDKLLKLLTKKK